ncbi:MAG: ABC transporter permease subunit [Deltaproteobacteria bacterium]|nr:ABC transporter permease subunit [Deltaproteobacteria bacterium]
MVSVVEISSKVLGWLGAFLFLLLSGAFLGLLMSRGFLWFLASYSTETAFEIMIAALGTLFVTVLSVFIAAPLGMIVGIVKAQRLLPRFGHFLDVFIDSLASLPSIAVGFLGYWAILQMRTYFDWNLFPGLLPAASCLAILNLPIIVRTTESAIIQIPRDLQVTGASLGFTPLQNIFYVLLPLAKKGIGGGLSLAFSRAAEDTAVVMLTGAVVDAILPRNLWDAFPTLSMQIFFGITDARSENDEAKLFVCTLVLLAMTTLSSLFGERLLRKRERSP